MEKRERSQCSLESRAEPKLVCEPRVWEVAVTQHCVKKHALQRHFNHFRINENTLKSAHK